MSPHEKCKLIVSKCCDDPKKIISWGKEIKIAKKLLKSYPDIDFWVKLDLPYKPNTLSWFLTPEGKSALEIGKLKIKHPARNTTSNVIKQHELKEKKIGEDKVLDKKPLTILDFLKTKF